MTTGKTTWYRKQAFKALYSGNYKWQKCGKCFAWAQYEQNLHSPNGTSWEATQLLFRDLEHSPNPAGTVGTINSAVLRLTWQSWSWAIVLWNLWDKGREAKKRKWVWVQSLAHTVEAKVVTTTVMWIPLLHAYFAVHKREAACKDLPCCVPIVSWRQHRVTAQRGSHSETAGCPVHTAQRQ